MNKIDINEKMGKIFTVTTLLESYINKTLEANSYFNLSGDSYMDFVVKNNDEIIFESKNFINAMEFYNNLEK